MQYEQDQEGNWIFIAKDGKKKKSSIVICATCNKSFVRANYLLNYAKRDNKKIFCSRQCSNAATAIIHKTSKLGEKNYAWKGGRKKVKGGYIRVHAYNHPNKDNHNCVLEHRLVMEKKIRRYLYSFETVHHKNGVKWDNNPDNLELFVSKHPSGQRPQDLIKWAREILRLYEKDFG